MRRPCLVSLSVNLGPCLSDTKCAQIVNIPIAVTQNRKFPTWSRLVAFESYLPLAQDALKRSFRSVQVSTLMTIFCCMWCFLRYSRPFVNFTIVLNNFNYFTETRPMIVCMYTWLEVCSIIICKWLLCLNSG